MDYTLQGAPADRNPPALPIKQRRHSSNTSSASDPQLERTLNLPDSSPLPSPSAEVFAAPTDCNAAQCPLHHYGCHQQRFFSDKTPPPIPKKKLVRTFSLPVETMVTKVQLSKSPHPCKNPHNIPEDSLLGCFDKAQGFNKLTFDTPDQHLPGFFNSFCHLEQVYMGIQNLYTDFVRNAVKHLEAKVLLGEQQAQLLRTLQPQDYVLCENLQPEKTECVFFKVYVPKVPQGLFAAKVSTKDAVSTYQAPTPHHPNVEEIVSHFVPRMTQENQHLSKLVTTEVSRLSHDGSAEPWQESDAITNRNTIFSLLERGLTVTVVRDFPWGTLEDFVQEGVSMPCSLLEVYERRLCLLVLQLALGLQHLESHNIKHAELSPQRIMLVWMQPKNNGSDEKAGILSGPKEGSSFPAWKNVSQPENRSIRVHNLWEKWGTPRVLISHKVQAASFQEAPSNRLQLGVVLKHCLQLCKDVHQNTVYTPGLLYLITQLNGENPGLPMAEIIRVLQAILWGPRAGLFEKNQPNTTVLHNWLMVKRSLAVLKLAEKGLSLQRSDMDWEEYLCLQYFALAEPETLLKTTAQLGLYNNIRLV